MIASSRFVDVQAAHVIAVARGATLLAGMGVAAWLDHLNRRVPNRHWIVWSQPVLLLWVLDLAVREADAAVWLTLLLPWAYASGAVIGRPSLSDLRAGSKLDLAAVLAYVLALVGLVWGAQLHASVEPIDLVLWNLEGAQALWWELVAVTLVLVVIDLAWRLRLLHEERLDAELFRELVAFSQEDDFNLICCLCEQDGDGLREAYRPVSYTHLTLPTSG